MEIKTFEDILKFEKQFSKKLAARLAAVEKPEAALTDLIAEKKELLQEAETNIAAAKRAVVEHERVIKTLTEELSKLEAAKSEGSKAGGRSSVPPSRKGERKG
jgi:hypothetical protein